MFSKAIVSLLFAASAIAGLLPEGTYKITNLDSQRNVRVDSAGGQLYISSANDNPGAFEIWTLTNAPNDGYTINNVGLNDNQVLDSFASVGGPVNGEPVVTDRTSTVFNLQYGGAATYAIKLPNDDLQWNVEPTGNIALRPADGTKTEIWLLTAVQWPPA